MESEVACTCHCPLPHPALLTKKCEAGLTLEVGQAQFEAKVSVAPWGQD